MEYEVRRYRTQKGKEIFTSWLRAQRDLRVRTAIERRVNRVEMGNFGDHKFLRDGVWELRVDFGPGFRVYYGIHGSRVVLLLCGGDKRTQARDIEQACKYWRDWQNGVEGER